VRWAVLFLAGCGASLEAPPITPGEDAAVDPPDAAVIDPPDAPRPCTGGTSAAAVADGSCVIFFSAPASFAGAAAQCAANNATLAVLDSAQRDAAAKSLIGTQIVFIGLTDSVTENTFVWADGTALAFSNFSTGEPNNANGTFQEDCIVYNGTRGGWDDRPCSNAVPGIGATPGEYPFLCIF
jgi:hypothetical protein